MPVAEFLPLHAFSCIGIRARGVADAVEVSFNMHFGPKPPICLLSLAVGLCCMQVRSFPQELPARMWSPELQLPPTPRGEEQAVFHGVPVAIPYEWLEGNSEEVQEWIRLQAAVTSDLFAEDVDMAHLRETLHSLGTPRYTFGFLSALFLDNNQ